jgi:unsaturated rhamnogalacturonyl hydrolase
MRLNIEAAIPAPVLLKVMLNPIVRLTKMLFKQCRFNFHSQVSVCIIYFSFFILISLLTAGCVSKTKEIKKQQRRWSVRMAESVMKRNPESWMIDFREKPKWEYTQGLVLKAILKVWETDGDSTFYNYVDSYYDKFIQEDGSIWLYKKEDYNIDRINPGKPLFKLYRTSGKEKYKKAIFLLRDQMRTHPRTNEGGFWHKKIYPYQMWLDGLYMGAPFLAQFASAFDEPELFDDIANQFIWMEKHARDSKTGLLYHGWDESHQQKWANPVTGLSPNFWGRSTGWFMMGLVDGLEFFPLNHPKRDELISILQRISKAIINYQDKDTGVWYQVVDKIGSEGNYTESSASCMYVYTLAKAVRNGYIDSKFLKHAQTGYQGILKQFILVDNDSLVTITRACSVAGLGGNPYRDGSYEYYVSEPIRNNDPKAVGPFILASLEFESLKD